MSVLQPTTPVWQSGHSLAAGYLGMWPLHEGALTTITDLMPSGHNGTLNAGSWEDGTYGKQLSLSADTHYVDYGNILNFTTEDFSLEVLCYPTSFANYPVVFGKGSPWDFTPYFLYIGNSGVLRFYVCSSAGDWYYADAGTLTINNWYHLVGVKRKTSPTTWLLELYVNGGTPATGNAPETLKVHTTPLRIGGVRDASYGRFDGKIAMAAIHGALTAANVATLYADPWGVVRPGIPVKLSSQRRFRL